ncbi:hypothetical protein K474DRAFT_632471 [Panus rudis PR-1116 ss-1]|nr:hypothetical protein K474DRAFT_632471 [Panus rudis PR-1116 ss-1]
MRSYVYSNASQVGTQGAPGGPPLSSTNSSSMSLDAQASIYHQSYGAMMGPASTEAGAQPFPPLTHLPGPSNLQYPPRNLNPPGSYSFPTTSVSALPPQSSYRGQAGLPGGPGARDGTNMQSASYMTSGMGSSIVPAHSGTATASVTAATGSGHGRPSTEQNLDSLSELPVFESHLRRPGRAATGDGNSSRGRTTASDAMVSDSAAR